MLHVGIAAFGTHDKVAKNSEQQLIFLAVEILLLFMVFAYIALERSCLNENTGLQCKVIGYVVSQCMSCGLKWS